MVTKGKSGQRDKLGVWDSQIYTTIYKIGKQQGPTVQHREYIQYFVINHNGKEYEKEYIHTHTHTHIYSYIYVYTYVCMYI